LILGNVEAPGAVYFNAGKDKPFVLSEFGDSDGAIYGLAVADLNRDGRLDIVAARSNALSGIFFGR